MAIRRRKTTARKSPLKRSVAKPKARKPRATKGKVFAVLDGSPMRVHYSKTGNLNTGQSKTFRKEANAMSFARTKAKEYGTKPIISRY